MKVDRKTPPLVKDFERLYLPNQEIIELSPAVTLHLVRTGESPANQLEVLWNYGSADCPGAVLPGVVPAMMMQGTKNMSGERIIDEMDFCGAFFSNHATPFYTGFGCLSLNRFTPRVLDILSDVIVNPVFPADRFEALKRKAIAEYDIAHKRSTVRARETLTDLLCGSDHPYLLAPTRSSLENQSLEAVRDAWRTGVTDSKIHIVVSGNITDSLLSTVHNFVDRISAIVASCPSRALRPVPIVPAPPQTLRVSVPDASQSSIAIGIPAVRRDHPDYIGLRIAVTALGGYFGSRLMSKIREEKGLTYGISATLAGTREGAYINIQADCDKIYTDKVLDEIWNELRKMASEPLEADELRRLKSYYMTTIAAILETFKSIADFYVSRLTVGIPDDYFDRQQEVLRTISADSIVDLARRYFAADKAITVIAGVE